MYQPYASYRVRDYKTLGHLFCYGPKDSGKRTIFRVFRRLANLPLLVSSVSPAAIYQAVDRFHPSSLFDEADRLGKEASDYTIAMQQILNVYCNEEKVVRASKENGNPVLYDCFSFKVIAGTEPLSGTLLDRVIRLDMEHNVRAVPVEIDGPEIEDIRRQLEYYKVQHELEVTRAKIGQMAGISLSNI